MTNPSDPQTEYQSVGKTAFRARVAKMRKRHGVPDAVKIRRKAFDSFQDLEDYMAHYNATETQSGKPTAMTSRQTRTTRADSAEARNAVAAALAKKKAKRDAQRSPSPKARKPVPKARKPAVPTSKPARQGARATTPASQPISGLMSPGVYNGDPWRNVGRKPLPREIDASTAKFRRQRRGVGKCTGTNLKQVTSAFVNSYYFVESARQEVTEMRRNPDARLLWHASLKYEEASLAYWFGADYSASRINNMLTKIEHTLTEWSLAHCAGFRGLLPVWIRCKTREMVGGGPARHLVENTIELAPSYFRMTQFRRWVTMLHEMGHRSGGVLTPRDERHDLCQGGWNRKENMCYRDHGDVDVTVNEDTGKNQDRRFMGGNPRALARAAQGGNKDARKTALNNIDNYVCYMWNRHRDHKANILYLLPPDTKAPRDIPRQATAPSSGS